MGCSLTTSLVTEAMKKLLDEQNKEYSSNLIAAVTSVILGIAVSVGNIMLQKLPINAETILYSIALVLFSFLSATLGYDKVVQTIAQLGKAKG